MASPASGPSSRYTRQGQGQQTVFARLQALFPASPNPQQDDTPQRPKPPKFLKLRIITWNMHDSLPKGDLQELLGEVGPHKLVPLSSSNLEIPDLAADANHPYHLVVVAGQECPSSSGIPMGLGAGFKLLDKEKEKEKDKERDKSEDCDTEKGPLSKHKDQNETVRGWKSSDDLPEEILVNYPTGWTSLLEHWLCHRTQANAPVSDDCEVGDAGIISPKRASVGNLHRRVTVKDQNKGPYVPLVKERMMGLYLAIYIHRDVRSLVKGTSKSAVTAGLIGGRVGNKGGVGISLNIDGTTLLFINAHLAAHEGKVLHRLANLNKIKTELSVDPFLNPDDPREMAEDITDRFDYTFLFGDLNFRLDITRLHADWLISRHEYEQALAFDQLRKQMETNSTFSGFKEAPINFPPTFKYDVQRSMKRAKTKASRRHSRRSIIDKENAGNETEGNDDDDDHDGEGEGASMASSAWGSIHSKAATDADDDDYFGTLNPANGKLISFTAAVHKAKAKYKTLLSPSISPSVPGTPTKWQRVRQGIGEPAVPFNGGPPSSVASTENLIPNYPSDAPRKASFVDTLDKDVLAPPRPVSRGVSTRSVAQTDQEGEDHEKGVYDSSHKQRVPSWCDRILWKSTVIPDEEEGDAVEMSAPRTRVSTFFNHLRPSRARRDSGHDSRREGEDIILMSPPQRRSSDSTVSNANAPEISNTNPTDLSRPPLSPRGPRPLVYPTSSTERLPQPQRRMTFLPTRSSTHSTEHTIRHALSQVHTDMSTHPLDTPIPHLSTQALLDIPPPVPPKDPSTPRWRYLFPFRRDTIHPVVTPEEHHVDVDVPQKGDVVSLGYNTLDDRGMRRLEGRSDHRPVVGSYAIYL